MIYLPTENEKSVAEAIVAFPWGNRGYSMSAVEIAFDALRKDDFSNIRKAMDECEDLRLPELIDSLNAEAEFYCYESVIGKEPTATIDLKDGFFADIRDIGDEHLEIVIQNDERNEAEGMGPLASVNWFYHVENCEFENMEYSEEWDYKFRAMAEEAVKIYKKNK